jgi:hypothetical protein
MERKGQPTCSTLITELVGAPLQIRSRTETRHRVLGNSIKVPIAFDVSKYKHFGKASELQLRYESPMLRVSFI